jgi:hypothetical protein
MYQQTEQLKPGSKCMPWHGLGHVRRRAVFEDTYPAALYCMAVDFAA